VKTEQLEIDVENSYAKAQKYMMEAEDLRRDLAIEKATLQQLEDTSKTDQQVQENLESRIKKELEAAQEQQAALNKAQQEDGKVTTTTHTGYHGYSGYYGWRWGYYGGAYSYTTSSKKDTTVQQNTAKSNISTIDERVKTLQQRVETGSLTRHKRTETTQANIIRITTEMEVSATRRDKEINTAKQMEEMLTEARLEAAGCNGDTSKKLAEAFKLTLPLFVELADNTAQVSVAFNTAKSVIQASSRMPVFTAISVFDSVTKLAIAGDFVTNGNFGMGEEMTFRNSMTTLNEVTQSSARAYQLLPAEEKDNTKLQTLVEAMPKSTSSLEKVKVVCGGMKDINPADLF
jgi:DNA repair exonuclease SbcCD ATPase subunit